MDSFFIEWRQRDEELLGNDREVQFFALEVDRTIIYVGCSHQQDTHVLVDEAVKQYALDKLSYKVLLGSIVTNIHNLFDKEMVKDIWDLLVFKTQPIFNNGEKFTYSGKQSLQLLNKGTDLIQRKIVASKMTYMPNPTKYIGLSMR